MVFGGLGAEAAFSSASIAAAISGGGINDAGIGNSATRMTFMPHRSPRDFMSLSSEMICVAPQAIAIPTI